MQIILPREPGAENNAGLRERGHSWFRCASELALGKDYAIVNGWARGAKTVILHSMIAYAPLL